MSDVCIHTAAVMGTVVTIQVAGSGAEARRHAERAMDWFHDVEAVCTRFDERSELRLLTQRIGEPVVVSDMLLEIVQFALALAEDTGGAFDPTVGRRMEARGFNREHRTGAVVSSMLAPDDDATFRDVRVNAADRTITVLRPLVLDLGAVAKGFAVDVAARELQPLENFAIDAGGDLYLGGRNPEGNPWAVGIRHPRDERELIDTLYVSDMAVCTSGDYERTSDAGHHIVDPLTGKAATGAASVTVVAPAAMVADGLATAAFVLGPARGLELLERHGVRGLIITPTLERFETRDA